MATLNELKLIGYLGSTPELKTTMGDRYVCSCSLATTRKNKDGEEVTQWHRLVFWGKQAEWAAKILRKGSLAYINGEIEYSYYFNNEVPRQKVNTTEVNVNEFKILKSPADDME